MTPRQVECYKRDKNLLDQLRPIRQAVAIREGILPSQWFREGVKTADYVRAREVVAYIAREKFGMHFELIGVACGWSGATTPQNAYERIKSSPSRLDECERIWQAVKGAK